MCYADDCNKEAIRKGLCGAHYQRQYLYGRLHKIKGLIKGNCTVEGCEEKIKGHGLCTNHYSLWRRTGKLEKAKREKRNHPFYSLWFERKQQNLLCEEWKDFTVFVKAISPKPDGDYFLVRLIDEPFGPNNFKWQEHLKRKEDENKKDWYARKWAARQTANPGMERARSYKRYYGLTVEIYNDLLKSQNFVCEICKKPETATDGKTGTTKRLAVDHCHKTGKVRGLLCWRCNGTLGRIEDRVELLQAMIDYLTKHSEV